MRIADSTSFLPKTSLEMARAVTRHGYSPVRVLAPSYVGCTSLLKGSGANPSLSPSTVPSPALPCQHGNADIYRGLSGPVTTCCWLSPARPPQHAGRWLRFTVGKPRCTQTFSKYALTRRNTIHGSPRSQKPAMRPVPNLGAMNSL